MSSISTSQDWSGILLNWDICSFDDVALPDQLHKVVAVMVGSLVEHPHYIYQGEI
jgi:hypothetical protein